MIGTGRLPAGSLLHQRYRLLYPVGQGGMGAVYVAQDTQLGDRLVAVKEMSMSRVMPQDLPQAVERFRQEAHLLASLHHPNLPVIYEYFGEDERWYLVMSFIEGQTLQAALDGPPGTRLSARDVVRIGIELCDVLEYLHTHEPQIIFRDLKPLNIMLTPKGHVCLIDFGIARHFKQDQARDTAYYYSVGYAPPEQYGQSQTGPRSDIYSLGATMHQMLSGHNPVGKPFQFPNLQLVDPNLPAPLVSVIARMLEMNEQARPASVAEVRAQLEKVFAPVESEVTQKIEDDEVTAEKVRDLILAQSTSLSLQKWVDPASQLPQLIRQEQLPQVRQEQLPQLVGQERSSSGTSSGKRRIVAGLSLIIVPLIIGLRAGNVLFVNYGYSYGIWLIIAGIGAAGVGLMFLLNRRHPLVDRIGGIALSVFGSLTLFAFLAFRGAACFANADQITSAYTHAPANFYNRSCSPTQIPLLFSPILILVLSLFLLILGTHLFLQSTKKAEGYVFGTALIVGGLVIEIISLSSRYPHVAPVGSYYYPPANPPMPVNSMHLFPLIIYQLLWLPPTASGIAAIIATFLRRRRDRLPALDPAA